jgi:hypothetical protein
MTMLRKWREGSLQTAIISSFTVLVAAILLTVIAGPGGAEQSDDPQRRGLADAADAHAGKRLAGPCTWPARRRRSPFSGASYRNR